MKNFKSLFVKEESVQAKSDNEQKHSFPTSGTPNVESQVSTKSQNPYVTEVIDVYEKGLQSINMPGYDFYDFFSAVRAAGSQNEAIYKMAFQMGKTMDSTITPQKLAADAEYYISKINEVHQNYSEQGNLKLNSLGSQLRSDKERLAGEVSQIENEINQLKQQLQALERKLTESRQSFTKIDDSYRPQQQTIQQKLTANDEAMQVSIQMLNQVRDSIVRYLK